MSHDLQRQTLLLPFTLLAASAIAGCDFGTSVDVHDDTRRAPVVTAGSAETTVLSAMSKGGTTLFTQLSSDETGVDFTNRLDLDHRLKRLYHSGFASGGIAAGDVDGDGRVDLYLVSGAHENRLYRQTDNFRFEDVTESAGVSGGESWGAGAAMIDIDNDDDLDIYVCNYDSPNQLYINMGTGEFREAAHEFGLDLIDACLTPAFCDYDRDGDLDVYVLTNRLYRAGGRPKKPPFGMRNGRPYVLPEYEKYYAVKHKGGNKYRVDNRGRRDHFMRNNGDGTFSEVSSAVGITESGHGLSVTWWDYDHDGWPDLYIGNDFSDPDHLYRNNGDGTFGDRLKASIPHTSWFSMGADFGDLNGDGRFDLLVADMSATTHYSQKTTMGAMNAEKLASVAGPPPQIMKNALYINSGTDRFYEAAELAGLADSDWTWAIKLADFDNDGRNDVFISNGAARSFNHSDHAFSPDKLIGRTEWDLHEDQPPRPEQNLAYRNLGDLKFEDVSRDWGLDKLSISYAAAYADIDRDGDLDLVVMNLDEPVSIYRNDSSTGNRMLVALRGTRSNRFGIGATVTIETAMGRQVRMLSPQTGFMSGNDPVLHFGLGDVERIDRLTVNWPSGQQQLLSSIDANRLLTVHEPAGDDATVTSLSPSGSVADEMAWYRRSELGGLWGHEETDYDDFVRQPLLPNKLSQLGPGLAVTDFDGDGDEDVYFGGAAGYPGRLLESVGDGQFRVIQPPVFNDHKASEDMGAVWFDADSDGDDDLYVASGGVEAARGADVFRDRLYLNDGEGGLIAAPADALPDLRDSSGAIAAADFDRDGDLDLFVASRVIPGDYPTSPASRLLENQGGRFIDATEHLAPELLNAGLITSAIWSDADRDGWIDLLLTSEWGPVRLLKNAEGKLVDATREAKLAERNGWWNGIAARDVDGDGDIDYVVTNFGLNTKYHASPEKPIVLYYGDFEGNGSKRLVEAEYEDATLFPVRGKSCSTAAMPHLANRFHTYHDFALASLSDIYTSECLNDSERFTVTTLESGVLMNDGTGRFAFHPLPRLAQVAPGFGVLLTEVNGDGHADLYLAQNFFNAQPETGHMDGGMSQLLLGNGDGTFKPVSPHQSGLVVTGDGTAVVECGIQRSERSTLLVGVNDGVVLGFEPQNDHAPDIRFLQIKLAGTVGNPHGYGARVTVVGRDGKTQTAEVAAGGGYLSQNSSALTFAWPREDVERMDVQWPDGTQSTHQSDGAPRQTLSHPNKK